MMDQHEPVRVGIVGAGLIGAVHAAAVRSLPEAVLVAACDPIPGKAGDFVAKYAPGARAYESLDELLESGNVEAVCVCTPHPQHAPTVEACAARGVHAIVEKPFTV